jgi:hypothetical protein
MKNENKCNGSCIEKHGNKWRVRSGQSGKLWNAEYDSKEDAEAGLRGYFANESIRRIVKPLVEKYLAENMFLLN